MLKKTSQTPNDAPRALTRVTVYAASSDAVAPAYFEAARAVGEALADAGIAVWYGGGGTGLMGAMADGALARGGEVHGVVPEFLKALEVSHEGLSSLTVVDDMRARKHLMLEHSDAVITLPGGCGTYEEVFEAMTLKRLGQWLGPIILLNTLNFYDRLQAFLEHSVAQRFMSGRHADMWRLVDTPEEVVPALLSAPRWSESALRFANVQPG